MTEEPYRWLEAIANRREYVGEQLRSGSPVGAASLPEGILLLGVGTGQSKVFELFDRLGMAALGHPADLEKVRQALIDAAHIEAYTRAPEDVSLRRLVSFGLSPAMKGSFEQVYSPAYLVEAILAELGPTPDSDLLVRLRFDGSFKFQAGGVTVASPPTLAEAAVHDWLQKELQDLTDRKRVADFILQAAWCITKGHSFDASIPEEAERHAGWRDWVAGKVVEVGWLDRHSTRKARYRPLTLGDLGL